MNTQDRNGDTVPTGLHFENAKQDFKNDYRFMNAEIVNEKLKSVKFRGVNWHVTITPTMPDVQRLNFQAQANAEDAGDDRITAAHWYWLELDQYEGFGKWPQNRELAKDYKTYLRENNV